MSSNQAANSRSRKVALITGITGQDGSYLAEFLLDRGYDVHGIVRPSSVANTGRIDHLIRDEEGGTPNLVLHQGDVTDSSNLMRLLSRVAPDEVYHLAAQSSVRSSYGLPEYTADVTGMTTLRILDAIHDLDLKTRFYQSTSSAIYGNAPLPQNEASEYQPRSPYAVSKLFAHWTAINYRESYGMFAVNGIPFNHESPRRGEGFLTSDVARGVARILAGKQRNIFLGSPGSRRDWGYAPEYVEAMWLMLQQDQPEDYVLATGESHSVREFTEVAVSCAGLDFEDCVRYDASKAGPSESDHLLGDPTKAQEKLGWQTRTRFEDLVHLLVEAEVTSELGPEAALRHLRPLSLAGAVR